MFIGLCNNCDNTFLLLPGKCMHIFYCFNKQLDYIYLYNIAQHISLLVLLVFIYFQVLSVVLNSQYYRKVESINCVVIIIITI